LFDKICHGKQHIKIISNLPFKVHEEDTGDYDNVVGVIPATDEPAASQKPKSRQSSYADLQRLRLSPFSRTTESLTVPRAADSPAVSPTGEEGLHLRQGHRTRRQSLSDGVPVTRLAAVDRAEPFADATHDLNDEINRKRTGNAPVD
jgi:glycerol-3-phosphate O-acyltransferase/dihydroxyacetone phosphate acyltransferase